MKIEYVDGERERGEGERENKKMRQKPSRKMTVLTYEKVIMFSVQHRIESELESEEALVY